jgi:hypothetical protein
MADAPAKARAAGAAECGSSGLTSSLFGSELNAAEAGAAPPLQVATTEAAPVCGGRFSRRRFQPLYELEMTSGVAGSCARTSPAGFRRVWTFT